MDCGFPALDEACVGYGIFNLLAKGNVFISYSYHFNFHPFGAIFSFFK